MSACKIGDPVQSQFQLLPLLRSDFLPEYVVIVFFFSITHIHIVLEHLRLRYIDVPLP